MKETILLVKIVKKLTKSSNTPSGKLVTSHSRGLFYPTEITEIRVQSHNADVSWWCWLELRQVSSQCNSEPIISYIHLCLPISQHWTDKWKRVDGWMDGWMDGRMDGWMVWLGHSSLWKLYQHLNVYFSIVLKSVLTVKIKSAFAVNKKWFFSFQLVLAHTNINRAMSMWGIKSTAFSA